MSEAKVGNEGQDEVVTGSDNQDTSGGMVKHESFVKVLSQKKAADQKAKDLEAKLAEYQAKEKAEEEGKLMSEKRYEEAIARLKAEREELLARNAQTQTEIANTLKRTALEREIGGFARPEYAQFADLKTIELNEDGSVDATSVSKEAARLREQHSHLLKPAVKPPTSGTPRNAFDQQTTPPASVSWEDAIKEHFATKG